MSNIYDIQINLIQIVLVKNMTDFQWILTNLNSLKY